MKKNCLIINTSRGGVINESDLQKHLKKNKNFRCFLDVMEDEQNLNTKLIRMKNTFITPHIGGSTIESIQIMGNSSIKNLERYGKKK